MLNVLGPNTTLGYCTNVHAGASFEEMRSNLLQFAVPVKQRVSPDGPMGVGLWLSADAARYALANQAALSELKSWMQGMGLLVYTVNGFPYGNFHEPIVKTKVYQPDWTTDDRYDYTLNLAKVLGELLPDDATEGSSSTLPLGWPEHSGRTDADVHRIKSASAGQLHNLVHQLARLELDTGKHIHIDLEPEPGCIIDTAPGMVNFFKQYLLDSPDDVSIRGYLRVCHDVCHSAVMFEPQLDAMKIYREAGLHVGKVQLSSAVKVDFESKAANDTLAALQQLQGFAEDRYQHQTMIRLPNGAMQFYNDLPDALAKHSDSPQGEWRIHFHIPVYIERFGQLQATQSDIGEFITAAKLDDELHHYEVETYAWNVLPKELQREELADGIADELKWVRDTFGKPPA
ncbi:MAG: metabolite traffic protein EboE [Phycisphaeraceae bacterium]